MDPRPSAGATTAIIEERRPVELDAPATWWGSGAPTRSTCSRRSCAGPDGELRPNPEAARLDARGNARGRGRAGPAAHAACARPSRVEIVELLAERAMLPGDRVHLQPGRVRRGGRAVPRRRAAAHRRRRARRDPRASPTPDRAALDDDDLDVLGYDAVAARVSRRASPRTTRAWSRR